MPEWVRQEREEDLAWIRENLDVFDFAAKLAYEGTGRGAIVVDTTSKPVPGGGHPFGYFSREQIEEYDDEDTKRMVGEYDPGEEFVLVLLKEEGRTSTYRVQPQWRSGGEGGQAQAAWEQLAPSRRREILGYLNFLKTPYALEHNVRKTIAGLASKKDTGAE